MIKRIVLLLLTAVFLGAVVSCFPDDGCGGPIRYGIDGIAVAPVRFTEGQFLEDTLAPGDTVVYHQYALLISPVADPTAQIAPSVGSWLSQAYACDPAVVPTDRLARVTVLSDNDFIASDGRTIEAGDTLAAYFDRRDEYGSVAEKLVDYNDRLPAPAKEYPFAIVLTETPAGPQIHQFTVSYRLVDGKSYNFTSDPVTITP